MKIGPRLGPNPTGINQVGYSSGQVPLCRLVPNGPLTECTPGTTKPPLNAHVEAPSDPADGENR